SISLPTDASHNPSANSPAGGERKPAAHRISSRFPAFHRVSVRGSNVPANRPGWPAAHWPGRVENSSGETSLKLTISQACDVVVDASSIKHLCYSFFSKIAGFLAFSSLMPCMRQQHRGIYDVLLLAGDVRLTHFRYLRGERPTCLRKSV